MLGIIFKLRWCKILKGILIILCLFDIESHNEWITIKEDPYLSKDVWLMDIHKSFIFQDEAPNIKNMNMIFV